VSSSLGKEWRLQDALRLEHVYDVDVDACDLDGDEGGEMVKVGIALRDLLPLRACNLTF